MCHKNVGAVVKKAAYQMNPEPVTLPFGRGSVDIEQECRNTRHIQQRQFEEVSKGGHLPSTKLSSTRLDSHSSYMDLHALKASGVSHVLTTQPCFLLP